MILLVIANIDVQAYGSPLIINPNINRKVEKKLNCTSVLHEALITIKFLLDILFMWLLDRKCIE